MGLVKCDDRDFPDGQRPERFEAVDTPNSVSTCRQCLNRRGLRVLGLGVWPVVSMGFRPFFAIGAESLPHIRQYRPSPSRGSVANRIDTERVTVRVCRSA